ncbi:MAG: conjugal transfer protein TraB, partial [Halalkalicoccus sp.]|nr:conjugal transfer protein TraB [Halalkalicoccus sp.]
ESLPPMDSLVGTQKGRRFSIYKAVGYLIALGFLVFFFLLVMAGAQNDFLLRVFAAWFLFNGVFAFALAKLAGAHWPSATVGGAIAWMTSVNPLLAPGWFAGYVELRYQRVNVADIGTLNEILADEESPIRDLFTRMLDVPLFRLIAVVAATNIGSIIATLLFPLIVLPWLANDIGGVGAIGDLMIEGARNSAELVWGAFT